MAKQCLLDTLGEVLPQVPAIGELPGSWRVGTGAVGVGAGPVAADHPGAGMLLEPGSKRLRLAVLEQIDGPVGGQIHRHGAVDAAATNREVVHGVGQHILQRYHDARLRVYVVWVKRWALDTRAEIDGAGLVDPRVTHLWAAGNVVGQATVLR